MIIRTLINGTFDVARVWYRLCPDLTPDEKKLVLINFKCLELWRWRRRLDQDISSTRYRDSYFGKCFCFQLGKFKLDPISLLRLNNPFILRFKRAFREPSNRCNLVTQ